MPRYFFDLPYQPDDLGADLPDSASARGYALRCAAEVILDSVASDETDRYWRVDVRRDDGSFLLSVLVELLPTRQRADRWTLEREMAAPAASTQAADARPRRPAERNIG